MGKITAKKIKGLRPFVRRCLLFGFLAGISYIVTVFFVCNLDSNLFYFVRKYTNIFAGSDSRGDSTLLRLREVEKVADVDILFIGSSHCYRGFDTRYFQSQGIKSFNLGTTAQSPVNSYYLLEKHIRRLKPKLIVMELYWHVLNSDGTESFIDIASNTEMDLSLLRMCLAINNIRAYNNLLFNLFNLDLKPAEAIRAALKDGDRYMPGGFVQSGKSRYQPNHAMGAVNISLNSKQLAYIGKIIEMVQEAGSRIAFITTPVADDYMNHIQNYERFSEPINRIVQKYRVPYFDFNRNMTLSLKEYFFDSDHLNQKGVNILNKMVYDALTKARLVSATGAPASISLSPDRARHAVRSPAAARHIIGRINTLKPTRTGDRYGILRYRSA